MYAEMMLSGSIMKILHKKGIYGTDQLYHLNDLIKEYGYYGTVNYLKNSIVRHDSQMARNHIRILFRSYDEVMNVPRTAA